MTCVYVRTSAGSHERPRQHAVRHPLRGRIAVAGLGEHRDRVALVTTSWELRHAGDAPRLVTAYIDG